jgi:hypothetical protein
MGRIRVAHDVLAFGAQAFRGRVGALPVFLDAVDFHKLGVVDRTTEVVFDRFQVRRVAIGRELHATGQAFGGVAHQVLVFGQSIHNDHYA